MQMKLCIKFCIKLMPAKTSIATVECLFDMQKEYCAVNITLLTLQGSESTLCTNEKNDKKLICHSIAKLNLISIFDCNTSTSYTYSRSLKRLSFGKQDIFFICVSFSEFNFKTLSIAFIIMLREVSSYMVTGS